MLDGCWEEREPVFPRCTTHADYPGFTNGPAPRHMQEALSGSTPSWEETVVWRMERIWGVCVEIRGGLDQSILRA